MTETRVHVRLAGDDVFAGTLYNHRRRGVESSTFIYDGEYLVRSDAYPFDPELPLTGGSLHTRAQRALFGCFTDCAPDRWGRTLLARREAALAREERRAARRLGELDYLLGVRDDLRQGALRFRVGDGPFVADDQTGVPALTDLPALMNLAQRAETETADLPDLQRLVRVGSSLGGARPKAHVRDSAGRIAIAKFPSANHDTWNVMAWEKVALDLAARAGIEVPTSWLLRLAGRSVLVLDRFDRTDAGDRIGYVSAMTRLEASDGEQRSYLEIAEAIEAVSANVTRELHQLWRRIVFSVLISNTDDHLRNHGFLHDHGDIWRLAPAFDLNPNPEPGPKYLSTAIDTADDEASLASALAVAEFFRLDDIQARKILAEVVDAVAGWPEVARLHGLTASELTAMAPAFSALERDSRGAG
jgi:serine/threonine-protein kinase HipA